MPTNPQSPIPRPGSRGQAAVEFAVALLVFAVALTALLEFPKLLNYNLRMLGDVRTEAGVNAISSSAGSFAMSSAAPITSLASLSPDSSQSSAAPASDPWQYPVSRLPDEPYFSFWRENSFSSVDLVPAFRNKSFDFRLFWGPEIILHDIGHLAESAYFPPLGGLKNIDATPDSSL